MSDYTLKKYTPDLLRQVCVLQKHLWGSSIKLNAAYLKWKYLHNPYIQEPLIYLALYGGRVVGMRAMFGTCWEAGDYSDKFVLPCAADTVIEPDHRDRGLFQELTEFLMNDLEEQGYRCVINLSPSSSNYVVSVLTMGWRPMGSSETLTRKISSNTVEAKMMEYALRFKIARRVRKVGRTLGKKAGIVVWINAFAHLDRNAATQGHPVSLSREAKPGPMAELIQQLDGDGRIRHVRDSAFFSWRFRNPRGSYRFLYWGGEDLRGYMILQNTVDQEHVNIVDWEGTSPEVRSDLLKAALNWGHFRNVRTWGATLSEPVIEELQQAGFTADGNMEDMSHRDGQFLLKSLDGHDPSDIHSEAQLLEPGHWDLRMIYSDSE